MDPHRIDPDLYLERLIEYEVTHRVGFEAVTKDCAERLLVELYSLPVGWTAFGRYTGNSREEKVDQVRLDEFGALAERMAGALLGDIAIETTLNRGNVLRSDSEAGMRKVDGDAHLVFGLGTSLLVGSLPQVDTDTGEVNDTVDFVTPPSVRLGYRGKFHQWGLDAYGRLSFGTTERALHRNDAGGHADFKTSVALGLQFLSYTDPSGIASAYYGLEVFQLTGSLGGRVFTLPGLALRLRREIDSFHLGLRISGAHILSDTSRDELTFRSRITTVAEAAWFAAPLANVSWYVGAHAGLEIQRFEGPATFLDPGTTATESTEVVTLGVRGGVELFRSTDMRADLHAELDLPTWPAKDRDAGVVDEWVPTLSIGVGVAF